MNGMLLHCGGSYKTYEEVCDCPVPQATRTYRPVPNEQLLDMVESAAGQQGLDVDLRNPEYARYGLAGKNGYEQMYGIATVKNHNHFGDQVALTLGFRNSCDKRFPAGICFGSKVFVCDNLAFTAWAGDEDEIFGNVSHKHTVIWFARNGNVLLRQNRTLPVSGSSRRSSSKRRIRKESGTMPLALPL